MRSLLLLALLGCTPAAATPEAFVEAYLEGYCGAAEECGVQESAEECDDFVGYGWRELCTSEALTNWDTERAAECLRTVESYACGPDDDTRAEHACWHICVAG